LKGVIEMGRCPTCGKNAEVPIKEWIADATHVSQYEGCEKKFNEYIDDSGAEEVTQWGFSIG
jgi:hypothetical protein